MNPAPNNKGQVTIFIIIAVIIVAAVAGFFILKDSLISQKIPPDLEPAYSTFLSCMQNDLSDGVNLLESQAGYIYLPDFKPGSAYMPFSSQLNFLGNPLPYWYYVSENNFPKEQVPSKRDMERQLEDFINEKIRNCVFDSYYEQGYEIDEGEPDAKVSIGENAVGINLNMNLRISKANSTALVKNHKLSINSNLGKLYGSAIKIYNQEQKDLFLEKRGIDVLRLYAPVDGIELTCSPKTWNADEVFNKLQDAIELNTLALKSKGNSKDYFALHLPVSENVRFINSKNWANSLEVNPSNGNFLIANPVGNQEGLGILGFCYVPYHFIYNLKYPVLVQVSDRKETFQFPLAVVIEGNEPRKALNTTAVGSKIPEICRYKNTLINLNTYDTDLNKVDSNISYECFGSSCNIGKTVNGSLQAEFPQCVNGYVIAKADEFANKRYLYSVVNEDTVNLVLNRLYGININLLLNGSNYNGNAIITFVSDEDSKTIVYPENKEVKLSEGEYNVQVYIYKNSSLTLEATTKEQCMEVPQTGVGGLFGLTKKQCFEMKIPSQIISNVLAGGGKETYYISEQDLKNSNHLEINAQNLKLPKSIDQLQKNYMLFDSSGLDIYFK